MELMNVLIVVCLVLIIAAIVSGFAPGKATPKRGYQDYAHIVREMGEIEGVINVRGDLQFRIITYIAEGDEEARRRVYEKEEAFYRTYPNSPVYFVTNYVAKNPNAKARS